MQTQAVYDFINAYPTDEKFVAQLSALGEEYADSAEGYARGISALATQKGHDLPENLVFQWLTEAVADYDRVMAERAELSGEELELVSGGSGTTTVGTIRCKGGYECRTCCPGAKCKNCYCPIVGC